MQLHFKIRKFCSNFFDSNTANENEFIDYIQTLLRVYKYGLLFVAVAVVFEL